jgi:hypothetical protein
MILLLALGCGATGEPMAPAPAPTPPPELTTIDNNVFRTSGQVGEVTPVTRAWTLLADGRRYYCVLAEDGRLLAGTVDVGVDSLVTGVVITLEGKLDGDVLVVTKGAMPAAEAQASPDAGMGSAAEVAAAAAALEVPPKTPADPVVPAAPPAEPVAAPSVPPVTPPTAPTTP